MIQALSALTSLLVGKPVPTGGGDGQAFAASLAELAETKPGDGGTRQKTADPGSVLPEGDPDAALALMAAVAGEPLPAPVVQRLEIPSDRLDQGAPDPVAASVTRPEPMPTFSLPLSPTLPIAPRAEVGSMERSTANIPVPIARVIKGRTELAEPPVSARPIKKAAVEADPAGTTPQSADQAPQRPVVAIDAPAPEPNVSLAPPVLVPIADEPATDDPVPTVRPARIEQPGRPARFASIPLPQVSAPASGSVPVPLVKAPTERAPVAPTAEIDPTAATLTPPTVSGAAPIYIKAEPANRRSTDAVTERSPVRVEAAPSVSTPAGATAVSTPTPASAEAVRGPVSVPPPSAVLTAAPAPASVVAVAPTTPAVSLPAGPAPDLPTLPAATATVGLERAPSAPSAPTPPSIQPNAMPQAVATATGAVPPADVRLVPETLSRQTEPRVADGPVRPAQPAPVVTPAIAAPVIGPAVRMFAAEIHRASRDLRRAGAPDVAAHPFAAELQGVRPALATAVEAASAPLDLGSEQWPTAMVERIERLRDAADASDTRIRLVPEALGRIDVSVKRDGDAVLVHFAAEQAATRAMLQEAQPKLAEAAEARGLKLGQTSIGLGVGGDGAERQGRHAPDRSLPSSPAPARARSSEPAAEDDTDHRIA